MGYGSATIRHMFGIVAVSAVLVGCMFLPFLPGGHDGLAVPLSCMAQVFVLFGLLLVPVGALWLGYEWRKSATTNKQPPHTDQGFYFTLVALVISSLVAAIVSLVAFVASGLTLGCAVPALAAYAVFRFGSKVKTMRRAATGGFNAAPLYLILVPWVGALCRFTLAGRATEFSRNRAMAHSAPLIDDIEAYRTRRGRYPASLASVWEDYEPSVIGIARFHYEPHGAAYNLFFEQFTFVLGTREFVVYNPLDEQVMTSHNADLLELPPDALDAQRGYHAVHPCAAPHWKRFLFD